MAPMEPHQPELEFESILEAYPVRLQNFEGPLDLLLHLIKKHELDIYDIPIALVTQQYLDVSRRDAGAEPRRRRRVPRHGGDADSHQVADAAAAAGPVAGGRRGGSARSADASPARASEVQGGRRAAAREGDSAERPVGASGRERRGSGRRGAGARDRSRPVQPDGGVPPGHGTGAAAAEGPAAAGTDFDRDRASSSCWRGSRTPRPAASRICLPTSRRAPA